MRIGQLQRDLQIMLCFLLSEASRLHAGAGDVDQALALGRDLADAEHAARVAKVAVQDRGAIHVDDVAFVQHIRIAGDTVTDHVVD